MNQALLQMLAQIAGGATAIAINSLWEGALLVVCIWLLLRAWPGINASTRYIVWSATLIATVVVPIATTLPFLAPSSPSAVSSAAVRVPIPMVTHALTAAPTVRNTPMASAAAPATSSATTAFAPRLPERFRVTLPLPVVLAVLAVWLLLTLVALARLGVGLFRLEQLKRDALPLPIDYRDAMARWTGARKGRRDVRLCVSDDIDVPVAVGLFDAMILIPRALLERLSENEVDQISLHELAHLRRADDWSNGLQRLAVAVFGWNPAVQFVSQQLDLEREVACDDWVLASTGSVRPYAVCLTKMAETSSWPHRPMPAPGVFATRKHISLRIERLLGAGRNAATSLSLGPAAVTLAIVGALAFAMQLVAPSVAASLQPVATVAHSKHVFILRDDSTHPSTALRSAQDDMARTSIQPTAKPKEIIKYVPVLAAISSPQPAASGQLPSKAHVHVPGTKIDIPPTKIDIPATHVNIPPIDVDVPAIAKSAATAGIATASAAASAAARSASAYARTAAESASAYARTATHVTHIADNGSLHSCNDCNMSGANWSGRDMRNVNFTGSDLSHSNFTGTNFSGGTFNGVDFTGSNLHGASFRGARLTGCDFSKANLSSVDFTGAKLSGCQFADAALTPAEVRNVLDTCTGCDFSNANLAGDDLSRIHVKSVDFSGANLTGANLSNSLFTGVDFGNARMNGANFTNAVFNGCDLNGVDLSHVDLSHTKFIGTDFSTGGSPKP